MDQKDLMMFKSCSEPVMETISIKCTSHSNRKEISTTYLNIDQHSNNDVGICNSVNSKIDEEKEQQDVLLGSAFMMTKPNIEWNDVAGLESAKETLKEAVILPIKFPQLFSGCRAPQGDILLYGPSGVGKTYLAKAVVSESNYSSAFFLSSLDILSRWNCGEELIRNVFQMARQNKPSIIIINEVEDVLGSRNDGESESWRRVKTELIYQMYGIGIDNEMIFVIATTSLPWLIDPTSRRRFGKRIYCSLPDENARTAIFQKNFDLDDIFHELNAVDLARLTVNYTGADICCLTRDISMMPVRRVQTATHFKKISAPSKDDALVILHDWLTPCSPSDYGAMPMSWSHIDTNKLWLPKVSMEDVLAALQKSKSTVNEETLRDFETFTQNFGQCG